MKLPVTLAALALVLTASAAVAQTLDAAARKTVVETAAAAMRNQYVFPDVGAKAAERIEKALAEGQYDAITDNVAFAERLTRDLNAGAPDGHLRVRAAGGAPPPPPAGAAAPTPPPSAEAGVVRADKLDGGIGYIEVVGFPPPEAFKGSLDRAMAGLKDSRALIVDVRRNGGGSPDGVAYLVSYFLPADKKTVINVFHSRRPGTTEVAVRESLNVPTPVSFAGKPLYVLTSKRTFSGGEEFAYDVQALKLGTLVGESTGGGANGGGTRPLSPQLSMFVPNFQPLHPATGKNWEGTGVIPEVAVPPADALKVALERLGAAPRSADIAALSTARVFAPRSTQTPGSDATLRRVVETIAAGQPAYEAMTPARADFVRANLAQQSRDFAAYGPIQSIRFLQVMDGGDQFEITHANARVRWTLFLDPQGKVASLGRAPAPATDEERFAAFRKSDTDGDGRIDKEGYRALLVALGQNPAQTDSLFAQRDMNRDGFVTIEEIRIAIPQ